METEYTDSTGIKHDIQIFESYRLDDKVFTIHRNGYFLVDLVYDEDGWSELYEGPTERSREYGALLSSLHLGHEPA